MHQYILIFQGLYQFNVCMKQFNIIRRLVFGLSVAVVMFSCNAPKHTVPSAGRQSGNPNSVQHHANPYPVIKQKYFLNTWAGLETCNNKADDTLSAITLLPKDSMSVYISDLNKAGHKLEGRLRGYQVLIQPGKENDPNRSGFIEGSFSLSNDHQTLKGFFIRHAGGKIDSCTAVYHPAHSIGSNRVMH